MASGTSAATSAVASEEGVGAAETRTPPDPGPIKPHVQRLIAALIESNRREKEKLGRLRRIPPIDSLIDALIASNDATKTDLEAVAQALEELSAA